MWQKILPWVFCYWLISGFHQVTATKEACGSIEINEPNNLVLLRDCNVIYGNVRITNLPNNVESLADLATNVEVITGYLLIYRANGIESLQPIFPRLMLIRGEELLYDKYALVVFENRNLKDLGLISLLRIQRGNIRIQSNPQLCFVETINWVYLLENAREQHFSLKYNKHPNFCPVCLEDPEKNRAPVTTTTKLSYFNQYCWNLKFYQLNSVSHHSNNCGPDCHPSFGCETDNGTCCDRHCMTACRPQKCNMCANLRSNGRCLKTCIPPNSFVYAQTECVTAATCRTYNLIPHHNSCVRKCPKNYKTVTDPNGYKSCEKICTGNFVIHKTEDLKALEDCPVIKGSVTIELMNIKTKIEHLENIFIQVKEITGYLRVIRSPQLLSLNFLRKLDTIRGEELFENKYALIVVNNDHLEHIWAENQNVAISKGRIYFHLNPRLCPEKIYNLRATLKNSDITHSDVSLNSNGERVVCGDRIITLNATVEDKNDTAARIKVDPFSSDELYVLKGYIHYYKEAPIKNVSMFDGRHGCGHDDWNMDVSPNRNVRHVLANLKPYTQYAFFVRTITMSDHHLQKEGYSDVKYFQTLPSKPGPVAKVYYHIPTENEIVLHWWPPAKPNGVIEKYLLKFEKFVIRTDEISVSAGIENAFTHGTCECNITDPYNSGPLPNDENYFIREQITYEEILPNIIYTRVPPRKQLPSNETESIKYESEEERMKAEAAAAAKRLEEEKKQNETMDEAAEKYKEFLDKMERKALLEQDTGTADYPILHTLPICMNSIPIASDDKSQVCELPEIYNYDVEVPGNIFIYKFENVKPELTYKISIRACVKDLDNGCGPTKTLMAQAISKSLNDYMKELPKYP